MISRRTGPGQVLKLVAAGRARTRASIAQITGLSRSTVEQRLDLLFAADLIREADDSVASGGRPARALQFNDRAGVTLCVDVGEERTRVALTNLAAKVIAERVEDVLVGIGASDILDRIIDVARELLVEAGTDASHVVGVGLGLPAPVDFAAGRVAGWSVMAGWDGFDIRSHISRAFEAPVLVDNDVNLLTLAEHRLWWPSERHLLYLKAGTGIGSGIIVDGRIDRGSLGAAGDIGHVRLPGHGKVRCRCGNDGCLEALTGGWALARDLRQRTSSVGDIRDARDVLTLVRAGDSTAIESIRTAGRRIGEAVAYATSLLNPGVIVIGGTLATAGDDLIAGIRELVYQRSLPLATRQLTIAITKLDRQDGILGAAHLVLDTVLSPAAIDRTLLPGT